MNLNREQLLSLAATCRIALTEAETEALCTELNALLALADCLPAGEPLRLLDEPIAADCLRGDVAGESLAQDVVSGAERLHGGLFRAPRTVGSAS